MYKLLSIITKPGAMSLQNFLAYWQNEHAALAKQLPGLRHYVQNTVVKKERASAQAIQADGFVELWFDSKEAMEAAFASDIGRQLIQDEKHFIGELDAYSVNELIIV